MTRPVCAVPDVSRETSERLSRFADLLRKWNPSINLVSRTTLESLETRHILDSAQLFDLKPAAARHWVDLGSGGGFPGLVIAILAAEKAPTLRVTLIESDRRKATFLSTVARELDLKQVRVLAERIETAPPQDADVVSARALAPLPDLLAYAERHLVPGGIALFPKGARHDESDDGLASWRFEVQKFPSTTDPEAVILKLGAIARV
jgi:16S rRNA (guanine527-N7)-methyltransferase